MKNKLKWMIAALAVLVALVFLLGPVEDEVIVKVPLPLERVMAEFETPESAGKWFKPSDSGSYKFRIEKANPFEFIFVVDYAGNELPLHFVVSPDTTDSKLTKIIYRYSSSRINGSEGALKRDAAFRLQQLGELLSTTEYVYGYKIVVTTVTDSSFLFQQKVVDLSQEAVETKKLFEELIAYASKRDANYNGVRILYSQRVNKGQVALFCSVGVNRYTPTLPNEKIQYKMMPYGKKLLVMDYEGPYGKTKDLYRILEDYKRYNTLVSMAIPFQKFITPGYGFADSQVVKTRISYPVF
jgi:hypothetical protein